VTAGPVLFYDGVCNFCDNTVQFVLEHERAPELRFAALQDPAAQTLLGPHNVNTKDLDTAVLLLNNKVYLRSSAVLHMAKYLRSPWSTLSWLLWVPRPLRDLGYRMFAANRYRLFGHREACRVPQPGERERFLVTTTT
jgi:predicted DCC family thiol-disulfide oxidoreductase YuxK